jgi:hypothetical protein
MHFLWQALVEWHPRVLHLRVGFIVTNLTRAVKRVDL